MIFEGRPHPLDQHMPITNADFVNLARFAVSGDVENARAFVGRIRRRVAKSNPKLAASLQKLIVDTASVSRSAAQPIPVDIDSRLELLRTEYPQLHEMSPIWPESVGGPLEDMIEQRERIDDLLEAGLPPPRSLLMSGPPGVGKTLAARYLAARLERPLHTLDLSSVMSSYLGKTGSNLRAVLEFAKRNPCVLFLDEFDAIAKRRDDTAEIGELKRLVTVLLQAIDDWPSDGVLVAATNHEGLLDPAIWRRFDLALRFPMPNKREVREAVRASLGSLSTHHPAWVDILSLIFHGSSFADIEREILFLRRSIVIRQNPEEQLGALLRRLREGVELRRRKALAHELEKLGFTQRRIQVYTGVSRETLRAETKKRLSEGVKHE